MAIDKLDLEGNLVQTYTLNNCGICQWLWGNDFLVGHTVFSGGLLIFYLKLVKLTDAVYTVETLDTYSLPTDEGTVGVLSDGLHYWEMSWDVNLSKSYLTNRDRSYNEISKVNIFDAVCDGIAYDKLSIYTLVTPESPPMRVRMLDKTGEIKRTWVITAALRDTYQGLTVGGINMVFVLNSGADSYIRRMDRDGNVIDSITKTGVNYTDVTTDGLYLYCAS